MTEQMDMFAAREPIVHTNILVQFLLCHAADAPNLITSRWLNAGWLVRNYMPSFPSDKGKRLLRVAAEESDGRVISGNDGYCLIEHATPEERQHAARRLISQGKKMVSRGVRILRKQHQIEGA